VAIFCHFATRLAFSTNQLHGSLVLLFDLDEHTGRFGGATRYFEYFEGPDAPSDVTGVMIGYPGMDKTRDRRTRRLPNPNPRPRRRLPPAPPCCESRTPSVSTSNPRSPARPTSATTSPVSEYPPPPASASPTPACMPPTNASGSTPCPPSRPSTTPLCSPCSPCELGIA
jgi:hypothetical protein